MRLTDVVKLCLLLTLLHFSVAEWVEISQTQSKAVHKEEGFTTPSAVWVEYQRERFGHSHSNSNSQSNPFIVSDSGGLKNSAQIVVPNNSQVIHARTKLVVNNVTAKPPVKVDVVLPPKVETTSRRHSSHVESAEDADEVVETVTEQPESEEETDDDNDDVDDNNNDGQVVMPSMQGFIKFLKSIQNTWITKSALSIENKIKLLKRLRDNMMKIIEQQFAVLWQPPERHRRRRRRGIFDESSIDFPPEAALMSINFLTFAVFLIKLVLQVVKIVKSKHYSFSAININAEAVRRP